MSTTSELIVEIANVLSEEKAYDLPGVCLKYGLDDSNGDEAYKSKRIFVQKKLKGKDQLFLLDLTKRLIKDYELNSGELLKIINKVDPSGFYSISELTRRQIMEEIYSRGNISGQLDLITFLKRIWDLDNLPSSDYRFSTATDDIAQHMINNSDWNYAYLFETYLELLITPDEKFIYFLEQLVHPIVRFQLEQNEYIEFLNHYLQNDGFIFSLTENLSGFPIYKINKKHNGVKGSVKNIIFAAIGAKPEIVFSDSINNDIKIVTNEENCLIFDRPLPNHGLNWNDLVDWWIQIKGLVNADTNVERDLYLRLFNSLDSEPEKIVFRNYFLLFKEVLKQNLPALVPQVYLHYDPYTVTQRNNSIVLPRQRMDFLLLFSNKQRIVIEIDGKQHYSDGNISSPKKYADMVRADRDLKLAGYEVYRFGGFEFTNKDSYLMLIKCFFTDLFKKHGVI